MFWPPISEKTDTNCSRSSHTQMRVKFKKSRQSATHKLSILHDPGLFYHPRYTMKLSIKENFRKQAFWAPWVAILRGYFAVLARPLLTKYSTQLTQLVCQRDGKKWGTLGSWLLSPANHLNLIMDGRERLEVHLKSISPFITLWSISLSLSNPQPHPDINPYFPLSGKRSCKRSWIREI